jgi:hypothetical protein
MTRIVWFWERAQYNGLERFGPSIPRKMGSQCCVTKHLSSYLQQFIRDVDGHPAGRRPMTAQHATLVRGR